MRRNRARRVPCTVPVTGLTAAQIAARDGRPVADVEADLAHLARHGWVTPGPGPGRWQLGFGTGCTPACPDYQPCPP